MPMTYEDRAKAARTPSNPFPLRVQTALVKHAKWQVGSGTVPALQALARSVINAPEAYAGRVALAVLVEPVLDDIESPAEATDEQLQGIVESVFPLFAAPEAE